MEKPRHLKAPAAHTVSSNTHPKFRRAGSYPIEPCLSVLPKLPPTRVIFGRYALQQRSPDHRKIEGALLSSNSIAANSPAACVNISLLQIEIDSHGASSMW